MLYSEKEKGKGSFTYGKSVTEISDKLSIKKMQPSLKQQIFPQGPQHQGPAGKLS